MSSWTSITDPAIPDECDICHLDADHEHCWVCGVTIQVCELCATCAEGYDRVVHLELPGGWLVQSGHGGKP